MPDEELVTDLMSQCREMRGLLDDPLLKDIAVMLMEGYTIDKIADAKAVSRSTVKRKKELIKLLWEE